MVAKETRSVGRADAGGVGEIFHADRNTVQRPAACAARELFRQAVGVATRFVGAHGDERVHRRRAGDAVERGVGELTRRDLAGRDRG